MTGLSLAPLRSLGRRIVHLDDAGRALDRARILLGSACEELLSAAQLAPEADELAGRVELLKAEVVQAWARVCGLWVTA